MGLADAPNGHASRRPKLMIMIRYFAHGSQRLSWRANRVGKVASSDDFFSQVEHERRGLAH